MIKMDKRRRRFRISKIQKELLKLKEITKSQIRNQKLI